MGERDSKTVLFHVAVFALIGLVCLIALKHDFLDPGPRCPYCGGEGVIRQIVPGPPGVPFVEAHLDCSPCDGSGLKDPYGERFKRILPEIRELLWQCLWLALIGALGWGLKTVECRLCRGEGRLVLEAQPPGEPCFLVTLSCVACQGRGRLGVIDRWVLSRGWEQPPERPEVAGRPRRRSWGRRTPAVAAEVPDRPRPR